MNNLCYSYQSLYKDEIFEKFKKKKNNTVWGIFRKNLILTPELCYIKRHSWNNTVLMIFSSLKFPLRHFYVTLYTSTIAYPIMYMSYYELLLKDSNIKFELNKMRWNILKILSWNMIWYTKSESPKCFRLFL